MRNLAIIPARGGSKRIPHKNIRLFNGKPIIAYSIDIAINSGLFDEVMVSTDDNQIAEIAIKYGAKVPFIRSAETANDFAPLADVVDEVVSKYKSLDEEFDNVCCILSTAPLLTVNNLTRGYDSLLNGKFDSIRPVVEFSYPIQRALKLSDDKVSFFYPEHKKTRSQDLEKAYHDAGQYYWMTSRKLLKGDNKGAVIISERYVQDIDSEEDWYMAEMKYNLLNLNKNI